MSNFLLHRPSCVHIHIPKTGGSTIRHGIWESRYDGPVFGRIPEDWEEHFTFAFVRHPLDRCVSAWADFSQLRDFEGTIDEFVDIVVDESVLYDQRRRTLAEKIRHHTIPQTHAFNCLSNAEFIGRYENFREDLSKILERVGMQVESIPVLRRTQHKGWGTHLEGSVLRRLVDFYEHDFETLGYDLP